MSYYPPMSQFVSADRSAPVSEDHAGGLLALARKIQESKGVSFHRAWSEAVSQLSSEVNSSNSLQSTARPEVWAGTNGASYTESKFRDFKVRGIRTKVD
jgi:hypothetical protein